MSYFTISYIGNPFVCDGGVHDRIGVGEFSGEIDSSRGLPGSETTKIREGSRLGFQSLQSST